MKKLSSIAFSLLFLTSCKYYGSWEVKEILTFNSKTVKMTVPVGDHPGYLLAKKNKFTFIFKTKPEVKLEIKIPKGKFKGTEEYFEVNGADVGQIYDFKGTSYSESSEEQGTCEAKCKDENGFEESCIPQQFYDCTTTTTTTYINLTLLDPTTKETKATFAGSSTD